MHTVWKNAGANRPRSGACGAVRCNRVVRLLLLLRAATIVFDHDVQTVQWKTPPDPSSTSTSFYSEGTYTARNVLRSVFRLYCVQIKIRCTRTCFFTITTAFFRLEKKLQKLLLLLLPLLRDCSAMQSSYVAGRGGCDGGRCSSFSRRHCSIVKKMRKRPFRTDPFF